MRHHMQECTNSDAGILLAAGQPVMLHLLARHVLICLRTEVCLLTSHFSINLYDMCKRDLESAAKHLLWIQEERVKFSALVLRHKKVLGLIPTLIVWHRCCHMSLLCATRWMEHIKKTGVSERPSGTQMTKIHQEAAV